MRRQLYDNCFWLVAMLFGTVVWAVGIMVVIGYVLELERLYHWWGNTPMALNTGLIFAFSGLAICFLGESIRRRR